ncbi:MAG: 50S ribosomal protein L6 [Kiritimatiellaeota bacterium]|nr:50S ribosomal protein L6 [Kiritimatiellota bacterium]
MSKIGNNPIPVPAGATVKIDGANVSVKGKLGEMSWTLPDGIAAKLDGAVITVTRSNDLAKQRAFHGLARQLVNNMIVGVTEGYKKTLRIEGVGFKSEVKGNSIFLSLGFANAKEYKIPEGAKVATAEAGVAINIEGISKELVGRVAADIRSYYPAEPYKGKGIRYSDEKVRRKEGKKTA